MGQVDIHGRIQAALTRRDWLALACCGGIARAAAVPTPPLAWSDERGVAWSVSLPGPGSSSPALWQDAVFVASEGDHPTLSAYDAQTGALRWSQPHRASEPKRVAGFTPTPLVEAGRVFALFESGEAAGYSLDGRLFWKRQLQDDLGGFTGIGRTAASLRRTRDCVLVSVAQKERSYLLGLDPGTGATDWKAERVSEQDCASTPVVTTAWGRETIILTGPGVLEGRSALDGQLIWSRSGLEPEPPAAPVFALHPRSGEPLVLTGSAAFRIFPPGRDPELLWKAEHARPHRAAPLLFDGLVYVIDSSGVLFTLELATGRELWSAALRGEFWATPIASAGRIYCFSRDGWTGVFAAARSATRLAANELGEVSGICGVAASDDAFYFRASDRLVRLSAPPPAPPKYQWGLKR